MPCEGKWEDSLCSRPVEIILRTQRKRELRPSGFFGAQNCIQASQITGASDWLELWWGCIQEVGNAQLLLLNASFSGVRCSATTAFLVGFPNCDKWVVIISLIFWLSSSLFWVWEFGIQSMKVGGRPWILPLFWWFLLSFHRLCHRQDFKIR